MTNSEIIRLAEESGFERVYFADYTENGFKTLIFLLMPYRAALPCPGEAVISNYYPVSNLAYRQAKHIAEYIRGQGFQAESNLQIPLKPYLLKCKIGTMGRNSLVAVDGLGSRFHIQTIATDAELERLYPAALPVQLAERCLNCNICVKACPTGALRGYMELDPGRCLRAVSEISPPPVRYRALLRNNLLGCDVCQDVCPVNAGLPKAAPFTVELGGLLRGDIATLRDKIGVNYARKKRLRLKAAVVAANLGRRELLPELEEMSLGSDSDEIEIAQWAINILKERG